MLSLGMNELGLRSHFRCFYSHLFLQLVKELVRELGKGRGGDEMHMSGDAYIEKVV